MRTMKRVLAVALAFAMVLTGLYLVKMDGAEVQAAAADVNKDMLDVKVQIATDNSNVMRFIASVDSLDYYKVGFEVTPEGGTKKTHETKTVYERISSTTDSVKYTFSPKVIDTESEYFVTAKLQASAGVDYTVRAFVITLDNETVYGASRCVAVEDGQANTPLNLSFETTDTTIEKGDSLDVTYTDGTTDAEVIAVDGTTVHVRVDVDKSQLDSATKFTFGDAGSVIYRNLYTSYANGADTTWYDVYNAAGETKFVIATDADLYGLQTLSISNNFSGKIIYLVSDIAANTNTPTTKADWDALDKTGLETWYGIGGNTGWTLKTPFAGTFDGQEHTISGIYMSGTTSDCVGFFRATAAGSKVSNFRLEDSYISGSTIGLGSIVGRAVGTFDTIYSNAVVVNKGTTNAKYGTGGIIGLVNWAGNATCTNCQFDGHVYVTFNCGGGIVGGVYSGKKLDMGYCLNTGTLEKDDSVEAAARVGGLCGDTSNGTLNITNCLNAGSRVTTYTNQTGSLIGMVDTSGIATINNSYGVGDDWNSRVTGSVKGSVSGNYATTTVTKVGITGYDGMSVSGLDYTNYWTLMADETPALKSFATSGRLHTPDVEWNQSKDGAYEIGTIAELAGVAWKVNAAADGYADADYVLTTNITANTGDSSKWKNEAPVYEWIPIGSSDTITFQGTFDGQGNSISGIYVEGSAAYQGLFGIMNGATVENLQILNSCIKNSAAFTGSVVGRSMGSAENSSITNIYSDAILVSTLTGDYGRAGGIVAQIDTGITTVESCWFDGEIISAGARIGGVLGCGAAGTTKLSNCLVTGQISNTSEVSVLYVGGIIGGTMGNNTNNAWELKDCLFAGTMNLKASSYAGILVGHSSWSAGRTAEDLYAASNVATVDGTETTIGIAYGVLASSSGIHDLTGKSLLGYDAINSATGLDYTSGWALREGKIPVPATLFETCCPGDVRLDVANAPSAE